MADDQWQPILALLTDLTKHVRMQTAILLALEAYQAAQPGFDRTRFFALLDVQLARLDLPARDPDSDEALRALLSKFEGPPQ